MPNLLSIILTGIPGRKDINVAYTRKQPFEVVGLHPTLGLSLGKLAVSVTGTEQIALPHHRDFQQYLHRFKVEPKLIQLHTYTGHFRVGGLWSRTLSPMACALFFHQKDLLPGLGGVLVYESTGTPITHADLQRFIQERFTPWVITV